MGSAVSVGRAIADELDDPGDEDRPTPLHLPPPPRVPTFGAREMRTAGPAFGGFLLDPTDVANALSSTTLAAAPPVAMEDHVAPAAPAAPAAHPPISSAPAPRPVAATRTLEPDPAWARPSWRRPGRLTIAAIGCAVAIAIALAAMHVVQAVP